MQKIIPPLGNLIVLPEVSLTRMGTLCEVDVKVITLISRSSNTEKPVEKVHLDFVLMCSGIPSLLTTFGIFTSLCTADFNNCIHAR